MLSNDTTSLIDYEKQYYSGTGNIDVDKIEEDRQILEGVLIGKLHTAGTSMSDIRDLEYFQLLYDDEGLEESIRNFYVMFHSDIGLVEEREQILDYVGTYIEKEYDESCSGDLHRACQDISQEQPQAVEEAIILKALVNGD